MFLLATLAAAHIPHALLAGAVVGDVGEPWWALYNGGESAVLYRSDDAGRRWTAVPAAPLIDEARRLARLEDGTLVLLTARRLWWSVDGAAWSVTDLEAGAEAVATAGNEVVVQVAGGSWSGPADGLVFTPGDVRAVGGGAVLVVVVGSGEVVAGDVRTDLPIPVDEVQSARSVAGSRGDPDLYLGTRTGEVWRRDDAWRACGPFDTDPLHPEVAALTDAPDGTLYALVADGRLYASTDGCASWTGLDTPFRVDFGGSGGAADVDEAIGALVAVGDDVVLAGWDGLVRGPAWAQERVLPPDYIRGASVSPDGVVYLASLAGVLRSLDGGATWDAPQRGAPDANVQRVAADPLRGACVWAIINHRLYQSTNGGADWVEVPTGLTTVAEVWVTDVPWIGGDGIVAWYDGVRWTPVATGTRSAWLDGESVCYSDTALSRCTTDRGATWVDRVDGGLVLTAAGPVALREDALLYEGAEVLAAGDDAFRNLTRTEAGVWYATTRAARIYQSADGVQWELLATSLTSAPNFLRPVGEDVLMATYDGAFLLRDGVAEPFGRYQAITGASGFDDCEGCRVLEDPCAWGDHLTEVDGAVSVDLRGDRVWVSDLTGDAVLSVDGVEVDGATATVADGWHEVRIEGAFRFGAIQAQAPGGTLSLVGAPVTDACEEEAPPPATEGCGSGRAGLLLPLLLVARRRRIPW